MWTPIEGPDVLSRGIAAFVSQGWYIYHPVHGLRCNIATYAPWPTLQQAKDAAYDREEALRSSLQTFHEALNRYKR